MNAPITHVAIRYRGKIYSLSSPNRHHHVLMLIYEEYGIVEYDKELDEENSQGFLDAEGKFLDREQALAVAQANGQLKKDEPIRAERLFSENLW